MTRRAPLIALLLLALAAAVPAGCDDAPVDADELATPRAAAARFYAALRVGDGPAAAACAVQADEHRRLAASMCELTSAGVKAEDLTAIPLLNAASLDAAEVVETGDAAEVRFPRDTSATPDRPTTVFLAKDGRRWRVDLLKTMNIEAGEAEGFVERFRGAAAGLRQGAADNGAAPPQ